MRTTQEIQSEVHQLTSELGVMRGQYLHHEAQLMARFQQLESELRVAAARDAALTPQSLHERLAALEAAQTKET